MDWMDSLFIFFLFVLTIILLLKMGSIWNGNCQNFIPGPRPIPLLGNLLLLDVKKPFRTLCELSKQYGPVFNIHLGSQKMVVLAGYETIKEAFVNHADAFTERPKFTVLEEIVKGYGIILAHGENWRVMRRFTMTTLRDYGMGKKTIENRITEECEFLIKKFESYEGRPFENSKIMNAAAANIIVSILFGERFEYEDPMFLRLLSLISENNRLLGSTSVLLHIMFPALGFLFGGSKTIEKNKDEMHEFIEAAFIDRLQKLDVNDQRNFIDSFLVRQQEEKNKTDGFFHNENLKQLVGNLFGAGTETTSTTLRWGLLLMMKYPEIQRKVQEEIAQVIGFSQPQSKHRAKMPYTNAVIHEIQRFSDVTPSTLPYATTMDITFKGYFIPKGTCFLPLLTTVLRDETQWEMPHKFYPEHFLDSDGKFVKRDAFMPFSAGRRVCVGKTLAKMELFLFFTSLLQRLTFQPAPGMSKEDLDLTPLAGLTMPPVPYKSCALSRSLH